QGYFGVRRPTDNSVLAEVNYGGLPAYTKLTVNFNSGTFSNISVNVGYWAPGSDSWIQVDDISLSLQ
ncbi:MAG TPA: hypothetical protein VLA19_01980, partial [Herpetosiphonaceae bacterium]|nr:hypothetical protein [Herpetosiphonaceae bacterium]